jgi:hypothetical protein
MEDGYRELMAYVRERWNYADIGYWAESGRRPAEVRKYSHRPGQRYYDISTGGWSGNEDIIAALERNWMFMAICWQRSRTGGHYLFAVPPLFAEKR